MRIQRRGDEHRSQRFLRVREEVEKCFGTMNRRHVHRIAIYVLRKRVRGMSIPQVADEAGPSRSSHIAQLFHLLRELLVLLHSLICPPHLVEGR
jgi:hypothetical protein